MLKASKENRQQRPEHPVSSSWSKRTQGLTGTLGLLSKDKSTMKRRNRHRLWIVGVTILALCSFLAGTSLACFQKGTGTIAMAEDCCQSHCQHAMTGEAATDCCQSHHAQASQTFPSSSPAKTLILAASTLSVALIPLAALHIPDQSWARRSVEKRPPPSPPFYTLHCALLI